MNTKTKNNFKGWVWDGRRFLPFVKCEHNSKGMLEFTFGVKNPKIMALPESTKIKWRENIDASNANP